MKIQTKFSPNDKVVLNKNNRQAGIVRFVNKDISDKGKRTN